MKYTYGILLCVWVLLLVRSNQRNRMCKSCFFFCFFSPFLKNNGNTFSSERFFPRSAANPEESHAQNGYATDVGDSRRRPFTYFKRRRPNETELPTRLIAIRLPL